MNQTTKQKVINLPNLLTYGRILAVPGVIALSFIDGNIGRWLVFALFLTASITDFFDGYLARMWHMQSALGRMLDPIADKLLIATCLLILTADGTIAGYSIWAAAIILIREISVSGLREFLAEVRVSVPVTALAKWKTTAQMLAIAILLVGPAGNWFLPYTVEIGIVFLWLAALLTLYTGFDYFRGGLKHLIDSDN